MGNSTLYIDRPEVMFETAHMCSDEDCGEMITVAEVVILLQVVLPRVTEQGQLFYEQFTAPDGCFAYEPYFFHDGCWANVANSLSDYLEEYDCRPKPDQYSFGTCDSCGSGLRVNELLLMIDMGEFAASERSPDGHETTFKRYAQPPVRYCLACARAINEEVIELWPHISFAGECPKCTFEHNWRTGTPCTHEQ